MSARRLKRFIRHFSILDAIILIEVLSLLFLFMPAYAQVSIGGDTAPTKGTAVYNKTANTEANLNPELIFAED